MRAKPSIVQATSSLHVGRRRPEALDDRPGARPPGQQPAYVATISPPIECPIRTGCCEPERADQVVEVEDEVAEVVVGRGLAVAVPAEIEGEHVEAVEKPASEIVEGVRVVAEPVHDHDRAGIDRGSRVVVPQSRK